MKRLISALSLAIVLSLIPARGFSQDFGNPGEYIGYISKANETLTEKYLVYLSSVSHGKSARKVEKRRQELLQTINDTRYNIAGMPPFKGDKSLRDTTVTYIKILNNVFNEDYGKIVNMEEIAEQSYDLMEAYLLAQKKANEKLQQAALRQRIVQAEFAKKNNVNLIDKTSELGEKINVAEKVMEHYHQVYLLFFKSYKQEAYLLDAVNQKKMVSIEQNINSLQKFSEQGLVTLKGMQGYNNDPILIDACAKTLEFFKQEADNGNAISDFFLKQENFEKLKKQFDKSQRTQQDVDNYNKAVKDLNDALKQFNASNADMNKKRAVVIDDWNDAYKKYMDNYIPTQQR